MSPIAPPPATASAPDRWRTAAALARAGAWLAAAVFGLLLLTWLTLHWAILPHIEQWRPLIEAKSSQVLGVSVRIGSIAARSGGWVPSVELHDVALLDAQGRPALQLSRVVASVSARSMLASAASFELRLSQLVIEGARLEARRDAAGRLFVAGMDFSGPAAADSGAADWFFRQREVAILDAWLRWTDEQRGAPPLALRAVTLVFRNSLRHHDLRLDATPPPAWGDRFSLRGEFTQPLLARPGDWTRWSGEAYADAPRADASRLRQYLDLPFEWHQGAGALRAWISLDSGAASTATFDLALREAALRLGVGLEPLAIEQLRGRLTWQRRAGGGSVALRQFEFTTGDGVHWPAGDLDFAWARGGDGAIGNGEFSAGRLDLAVIARTAERLPLGQAVRTLLAEANPRGVASDVKAAWDGPLDALARYRIAARLSDLSLDAQPAPDARALGRPGLHRVAVELHATEAGGEAALTMKDGALDLPGVLAEPLVPLAEMQARLRWRVEPRAGAEAALQVQLLDARLANQDAQGVLNATWKTGTGPARGRGGRFPGLLVLDGTLSRGVAARTARYLPLGVPEGVRSYLEHALLGGSFKQVTFKVDGDLSDFPRFAGTPGEFRVAVVADEVTLAYVPGMAAAPVPPEGVAQTGEAPTHDQPAWPPMTAVSGEIVVDRGTLEFQDARAKIFAVELGALSGGIRNLADQPVLTLQTQAHGPLADVLRFVHSTPVNDWIHGALQQTTASGNATLELALTIPLQDRARTAVSGRLQLAGSELRLRRELPLLSAVHGRVDFTQESLAIVDAGARMLGGEVAIDGGTQPDEPPHFNVHGRVSAEALRLAPELGPLARLAGALSGTAGYRLTLTGGDSGPEFDLTSDLVGLASDLPAPLGKAAETALPLHVQTTHTRGADGRPIGTLQVELGAIVRAHFEREPAGDAVRVARGGIGVFEPAPTPAHGVAAAVTLEALDLDAWDAVSSRLFGTGPGPGDTIDSVTPPGYTPTQIGLKVQALSLAGRTLTHLAAGLSQLDGQWRATLDADQIEGYLEYRPPGAAGAAQAGRVYARLARLSLPKNDADEVANLLDRQPASVPALDIVVDDLELRGRRLGRMEVQAVNRLAPTREWELTHLRLSTPEAQLSAAGHWAATAEAASPRLGIAARRRAVFDFELDIADSGALLQRLGSPDAVRGGKGRLKGQVAWLGSPLNLDLPSLSGQFSIAVAQGQFLQVEPGAARLLGVLSMQSLARRLSGDFRDLFQEGFIFDSISGDVAISHGVASTNNLLIRGMQAAVLMEGSADIEQETQDLRVVVVPDINVGAASLAVAVINPVVGLGTFLAQWFLREPLAQAGTREFNVRGPWADPQVEPVTRRPGQALPRMTPPDAASGASSAQ